MSGLRTAIVSYCRRPGGHSGSSLSSTAARPGPGGDGGSSSDTIPPSKNEPEKSRVWAFTESSVLLLLQKRTTRFDFAGKGLRLWEKEIMAEEEEVDLDGNVGEEGVRVEVSEEDAIVELCFGNRVN